MQKARLRRFILCFYICFSAPRCVWVGQGYKPCHFFIIVQRTPRMFCLGQAYFYQELCSPARILAGRGRNGRADAPDGERAIRGLIPEELCLNVQAQVAAADSFRNDIDPLTAGHAAGGTDSHGRVGGLNRLGRTRRHGSGARRNRHRGYGGHDFVAIVPDRPSVFQFWE
ncbi:MAG: hypothetical protein UX65_C0005G0023 [Parcubacteria group bacterium GW2011_GWB1_46_8]|nr:MAG: hypothetical protein UX15_C0011G0003 [Parcubacteria group bacterium GW2011_GWA1_45_7]KKU44401.1 MAG: hypothetical protein UX61_C0001G0002 [Parcubacteria group bacterium GW2011_GWA2_46_7]KKU46317.1 MAG: hypothetical protein UX65_C0005G0023 [Parcubacteria group bacterium GW2011_GWB1_46_8]